MEKVTFLKPQIMFFPPTREAKLTVDQLEAWSFGRPVKNPKHLEYLLTVIAMDLREAEATLEEVRRSQELDVRAAQSLPLICLIHLEAVRKALSDRKNDRLQGPMVVYCPLTLAVF